MIKWHGVYYTVYYWGKYRVQQWAVKTSSWQFLTLGPGGPSLPGEPGLPGTP